MAETRTERERLVEEFQERVERLEKRLNALEFPAFGEDSTP